ncbi:MAG: hemin uptake protein HemP [Pirellulaceae bacterium]|nr:hemin uptake protein HemP [Pirellulaceae bacterium]
MPADDHASDDPDVTKRLHRATSASDQEQITQLKVYNSHDLFQGADQIVIVHGDQEYRLRVTRNQKLILYK